MDFARPFPDRACGPHPGRRSSSRAATDSCCPLPTAGALVGVAAVPCRKSVERHSVLGALCGALELIKHDVYLRVNMALIQWMKDVRHGDRTVIKREVVPGKEEGRRRGRPWKLGQESDQEQGKSHQRLELLHCHLDLQKYS